MSTFRLEDYGVSLTSDTTYVTCEHTGCKEWLIEEFGNGWSLAEIAAIAQEHHSTHHREPHLEGNGQ